MWVAYFCTPTPTTPTPCNKVSSPESLQLPVCKTPTGMRPAFEWEELSFEEPLQKNQTASGLSDLTTEEHCQIGKRNNSVFDNGWKREREQWKKWRKLKMQEEEEVKMELESLKRTRWVWNGNAGVPMRSLMFWPKSPNDYAQNNSN